VSRLSADKKIQDVIAILPSIIKHHPRAKLFIIGDDFGHLVKLRDQVARSGLINKVEFLGPVDRQQLLAAYQHADLFIHPSNYEAFGIVIAEAMAARAPVIARRTSAVPYVAPHQQCALLFNNQDELLAHTLTILSNDTLSQRLVEQAVTRVENEFTWEQSIKKLTDLYKDISSTN
jgi:glycosyltransferase involved in cell wall biosynthesis